MREAVRACGKHTLLTHYGAWNFAQSANGEVVQEAAPSVGGPINYKQFLAELQQSGYDGYAVSEYCLPCVKDHRIAGVEAIDLANVRSLAYMKSLVMATQIA
jgi:sugar phosphate isomerase/epimerase